MSQQQAMQRDDWVTPKAIIDALGPFDLDPCAGEDMPWVTAKVMVQEGGLELNWKGTVWLNPPYGKGIDKWLSRLCHDPLNGIALVPANTDAKWFHNCAWQASAILWRKGRISFCDRTGKALKQNTKGSVFLAFGRDMVGRLAENVDNPAVGNNGYLQIIG